MFNIRHRLRIQTPGVCVKSLIIALLSSSFFDEIFGQTALRVVQHWCHFLTCSSIHYLSNPPLWHTHTTYLSNPPLWYIYTPKMSFVVQFFSCMHNCTLSHLSPSVHKNKWQKMFNPPLHGWWKCSCFSEKKKKKNLTIGCYNFQSWH